MSEIKVVTASQSIIVPQNNDNFIDIFGKEIVFDEAPQNVIIIMTNIDITKITRFDLNDILILISAIRSKFPRYLPSIDIYNKLNAYINDFFSKSFWERLSSVIDNGFEKMNRRKFPYYKCEDLSWKDLNMKEYSDKYPAGFHGDNKIINTTSDERNQDWKDIEEKVQFLLDGIDIKDETKEIKEIVETKEIKETITKPPYKNTLNYLEPMFYPNLDEYKLFIDLLYSSGLNKLVIKTLCVLPLTFNCCHVIKYEWFWKYWNELIFDKHLKNYIIYYSMYIMKLEEISAYNNVPDNMRFVFSLDEARLISNNIPSIGIDKHPLLHLMEPLSYKSSTLPFYVEGVRTINSIDEFKKRLSIATDGLLNDLNLAKYNAVLSGSIIVSCISTNPLEKNFNKTNNNLGSLFASKSSDYDWFKMYIECYYPSYRSVKDDELHKYQLPIQTPDEYEKQKCEDLNGLTNIEPSAPAAYGVLSDLDISIHVSTFATFIINSYKIFEEIRDKSSDKRIYMKRIGRATNFKYNIYGPGINRPIDLFWITNSPDSFVSQFHLGIVRSYWDGNKVSIMQSSLASHLTGVNHDYYWLSCKQASAIPIAKYASRGYSTSLNISEQIIFTEYLSNKIEWTKSITDHIFNPVMHDNLFFKLNVSESGIRYNLKKLEEIAELAEIKISIDSNVNNTRVAWQPILCVSYRYVLDYYNENKNSVGTPTLDIIDKIINEILL